MHFDKQRLVNVVAVGRRGNAPGLILCFGSRIMMKKDSRRTSRAPAVESLENRTLLTQAHPAVPLARVSHAPLVADMRSDSPATKTTIDVHSGTIGQAITFTVNVRDSAAFGAPTGSVNLVVQGTVIQTLTLTPTTSSSSRFDYSTASYTIPAAAGGPSYYFGSHTAKALYNSNGEMQSSKTATHFRIATPRYTNLGGGLKAATVVPGSGPGITAGQNAFMLYTGYLARDGKIFDDSVDHGGEPFEFTVEASPEQVITGFDEGTVGMAVGETRVLLIPPSLGYGVNGAPPTIPPNAKLVFLVTLVAIT
jgi:FKBP-type peptidyl-prolyl cis-trans isomerase